MVHEVRLRNGADALLQRPITDDEFAQFDAIYGRTSGSLDERLNATFAEIADRPEAETVRSVISLYQVFFGRQPDAGGLNFYTDAIDSGATNLEQVAEQFGESNEFNIKFGRPTPTEIVFAQYRNVLGREPDFEGLTFWTSQVQDGNLTIAQLARFFATSDEAQARFDPFIDAFLVNEANGVTPNDAQSLFQVTRDGNAVDLTGVTGDVVGTVSNDVFQAETGEIGSASNIDGGGGANDILEVFNDGQGNAISPTMRNVETVVWTEQTNDRNSNADNNVGGYGPDATTQVDVELDAGRIRDVTRWEDFDSRADLVIEDARDNDDTDGTFTGNLEVAMVSTDAGNVDYAIYFDDPVNTTTTDDSIFIQVIDQNNSRAFSAAAVTNQQIGSLEDARLDDFTFILNGERVQIVLDRTDPDVGSAFFGPNATYTDLLNAINAALDNATLADGTVVSTLVSASFGNTFVENIGNDNVGAGSNSQVFGRQIVIDARPGVSATLADAGIGNDFTVTQLGEPADIAASVRAQTVRNDELVRINVDLDDVGKGSMGGDLMIGAMSTGRQVGDDGTSDSAGIQQFDIEVDRSSQLQTINSTNNTLEVVNVVNGENDGPNNTTTATDEATGDLVVRGQANPPGVRAGADGILGTGDDIIVTPVATDNAMPGAAPQHNGFGFSDVRQINAATMVGSVDFTAELTDEIVEKYLNTNDTGVNGNSEDVTFDYDLGTNNDEFLLNMSSSALLDAGTAAREDFRLDVDGNGGNDVIVTNVGDALKTIDSQGQDTYDLVTDGGWYPNQDPSNAATMMVDGGAGNDSIWTHGWGDSIIDAGTGADAVYTDNEGTVNVFNDAGLGALMGRLDRNVGEHTPVDYEVGAVWTFNDDNGGDGVAANIQGSTNTSIAVNPGAAAGNYSVNVTVSFRGSNDDGYYTSTVNIPQDSITTAGNISEQDLNQAIKRAINSTNTTDANGATQLNALNKVLEAVDGPGQSMAVYSKIDGDFDADDLLITATQVIPGGTNTAIDLTGTAYDTGSAGSDFQNFGRDSIAESDNIIDVATDGDFDVTVLSTGADSNESFVFRDGSTSFGTETIFNFEAGGGTGADRIDFREINFGGNFTTGGGINGDDDSITILEESTANDSVAEVAALFNDAGNAALEEKIAIVYDEADNNTGRVYLITDTAGAAPATARVLGDIELIGTDWDDMTADNFFG